MDGFFCGKCGMRCLIASSEELTRKIVSQLTIEEITEGYTFEGNFEGSIFSEDGKEICFCEKCLTRIEDIDEIFCFGGVYLCENCREVKK